MLVAGPLPPLPIPDVIRTGRRRCDADTAWCRRRLDDVHLAHRPAVVNVDFRGRLVDMDLVNGAFLNDDGAGRRGLNVYNFAAHRSALGIAECKLVASCERDAHADHTDPSGYSRHCHSPWGCPLM